LEFLDACRKFISIDSTPSVGNLELAVFAETLCRQSGLSVELQRETLDGLEQANIIARPQAQMPREELLLQTHLDTVDPGSFGLWTKTGANPFQASIYQNELYGLGSADVKLDFLCKLEAIRRLKDRSSFRVPPVLVGTFGEERGMSGAVKLIRKKKVSATRALVGEPTELRLVHAMKGFAAVEIEVPFSKEEIDFHNRHNQQESTSTQSKIFIGKAAHSSVPGSGDNAIVKMLEYLERLPEGLVVMELDGGTNFNTVAANAVLEFDAHAGLRDTIGSKLRRILRAIQAIESDFVNFRDEAFLPPQTTLNVGVIRTLEDHVKMLGCVRLPPVVTQDVYENWMQTLRDACQAVGAVFRVTDYKQPFRTSVRSDIVQICQAQLRGQGLPTDVATHSVTNEANVFSRFGIECVVIGPGRGVGNSHSPNEFVRLSELEAAVVFYQGVIERMCL